MDEALMEENAHLSLMVQSMQKEVIFLQNQRDFYSQKYEEQLVKNIGGS